MKCNSCEKKKPNTVSDRIWTKALEEHIIELSTYGFPNSTSFSHFCSDSEDFGADVTCSGLCIENEILCDYGMLWKLI